MSEKLHLLVKEALNQFGKELIQSVKFVKILDDYNAFEDIPAAKQILKELLLEGYGERIYILYSSKKSWTSKFQTFVTDFRERHEYRDDLVYYVFQSLAYGLGWISDVSAYSPSTTQQQPFLPDVGLIIIPDLEKQLKLLKKEYISLLNSLITLPRGKIYKGSGYYSAFALSQLWLVENKIDITGKSLRQDNSSWCQREKDKILKLYEQRRSSQIVQVIYKLVLPVAITLAALFFGASYIASFDEISLYNVEMAKGDQFYNKLEYEKAIECYQNARDQYDGFFNTSGYKLEAKKKISNTLSSLLQGKFLKSDSLFTSGNLSDALYLLEEQKNIVREEPMKTQLANKLESMESKVAETIETEKNTLILNIATNKGKLSVGGRIQLGNLLKVAPDDYWLNFIKNKDY